MFEGAAFTVLKFFIFTQGSPIFMLHRTPQTVSLVLESSLSEEEDHKTWARFESSPPEKAALSQTEVFLVPLYEKDPLAAWFKVSGSSPLVCLRDVGSFPEEGVGSPGRALVCYPASAAGSAPAFCSPTAPITRGQRQPLRSAAPAFQGRGRRHRRRPPPAAGAASSLLAADPRGPTPPAGGARAGHLVNYSPRWSHLWHLQLGTFSSVRISTNQVNCATCWHGTKH